MCLAHSRSGDRWLKRSSEIETEDFLGYGSAISGDTLGIILFDTEASLLDGWVSVKTRLMSGSGSEMHSAVFATGVWESIGHYLYSEDRRRVKG